MATAPPPTDSPTAPTPPSSSSSSSNSTSSSPPPASQSSPPPTQPSSPPPSSSPPPVSAPPPKSSPPPASSPPPPDESKAPPPKGSDSPPPPQSSSSSPPPPSPPPPTQNGDNGNNNNNNSPRAPPPLSRSSNHSTTPPPKSLSPSSRGSSSDSSPSNDGGNNGSSVNAPVIIGVVVGAGLLLVLLVAVTCCVCTKRKRKKDPQHDQMPCYANASLHNGGEYYNNGSHLHQNWHNSPPQHTGQVHLPPPPGSANGGWHTSPPPPPQPAPVSSDMNSRPYGPVLPPPPPSMALGNSQSSFTYEELAAATGGFSQANILGQGGFGYVHKGVLPNGKEIAVKSLKSGSGQGEREFQAEVEIISGVHHRHLVSLVGYCVAGGQRMLVYEFIPNGTLEFHLRAKGRPPMEWSSRIKIAIGSAKGLAYLHEDCHPRIIHRDIKASNILIDSSFEAKVADFGLARLSSDNFTHVSTRVMGTFGYLAPEYASSGKLTDKSDVFSFGVMLLELITGRRPIDPTGEMEESLVDWARPLCLHALEIGNFDEVADPFLEGSYDQHEMACMVACATASIRHSARRRPKMSQIVRALEGDGQLEDLNEGTKPGQSSIFSSSTDGSDYDNGTYTSDMKKFRKMALMDSQEYASSEFGRTSEYGLNPSTSSSSDVSRSGVGSRRQSP